MWRIAIATKLEDGIHTRHDGHAAHTNVVLVHVVAVDHPPEQRVQLTFGRIAGGLVQFGQRFGRVALFLCAFVCVE